MKSFSEFQESVASLTLKGGSKLVPALMTGIGAAGTIMQSKKKDNDVNITPKKNEAKETKKLIDKYKKTGKVIRPKEGEVAKQRKLLKNTEKNITQPKKGEKKEASKTVKDFLKARKKEGKTMYKLKQDDEISKKGPGDLLPAAKKTYLDKRLKNLRRKKINEGVASLALKGGSKLVPALMTGIGAAGTIMQIKNPKRSVYTGTRKSRKKERIPTKADEKTVEVAKDLGLDLTDPRQRRKAQSRAISRGLKKQNKTNKKINPETGEVIKPRYNTKLKGIQIQPKKGEAEATEKLIDKINNPNYLEKVRRNVRKEEAIANSLGGGNIAGTAEANDDPPVKKKKRYIYGGRGSRRMWMS